MTTCIKCGCRTSDCTAVLCLPCYHSYFPLNEALVRRRHVRRLIGVAAVLLTAALLIRVLS